MADHNDTEKNIIRINFNEMAGTIEKILLKHAFPSESAQSCARVITESTRDGIISHGIARVERLVRQADRGEVDIHARAECVSATGMREQWEGNHAIGICNALAACDRAVELAKTHGLGMISIRNTTHWLRGGTYGWRAAERNCAFICWTNTTPNMVPWGGEDSVIGNNPMVIAVPRKNGHFVLDMAMSQYSYGKMGEYARENRRMPTPAGFDESGEITDDPAEVLKTGKPLPTGFWKGSALAMVLDLLAGSLSNGFLTESMLPAENTVSQVFIAIDMSGKYLDSAEELGKRIIDSLGTGGARHPGQGTLRTRSESLEKGIAVPEKLWREVVKL